MSDERTGSPAAAGTAAAGGAPDPGSGATVELPGSYPRFDDGLDRLWTPHRMAYIQAGPEPLRETCPFCAAPGMRPGTSAMV